MPILAARSTIAAHYEASLGNLFAKRARLKGPTVENDMICQ